MRFYLLLSIFIFSVVSCNKYSRLESSAVLAALQVGEKTSRTFYFYPSILRIINLQHNPDYYRLIRNIEKIIVYRLIEDFSGEEWLDLKLRLEKEESFEEYANLSSAGQQIFILGKENPFHSVFMVPADGEYYVIDVMGQINYIALNRMIQLMKTQEEESEQQFLDIFQLIRGRQDSGGENELEPADSADLIDPQNTHRSEIE